MNFAKGLYYVPRMNQTPLTLPTLRKAFNCRSLPFCFHKSSTKWFAINACTSNAVGLLPSLRKLLTDSTERATSKCHFIIVTHLLAAKIVFLDIRTKYIRHINILTIKKYVLLLFCLKNVLMSKKISIFAVRNLL